MANLKNITLNGAKIPLPTGIPYSSMIAKGMKEVERQQAEKNKADRTRTGRKRYTTLKAGKPALLNDKYMQAAIEQLYMFEETGISPYEIHIQQERVKNLEKRIKQLESYD